MLLVLTLGFFMILLDTTIVNVAIPSIIDSLHASLDQILWVLNSYVLVYAVLLITAGRLGDMVGPKKLFIAGIILFTLASAACGLAQNPNQLILFRVIQGIGGALLTPQTLSLITSIFPPEKRGAAFGVWGAVGGLAAVAGPTLGGFLTTYFSWRAIFYVNVPIGIVAVILAFLLLPELRIYRKHHLDYPGVILSSAGLFAIVFGLIEGERYNWARIVNVLPFSIGSMQTGLVSIQSIILLGVILLVLFVIGETRAEEPLLPLSLFHDRNYTVGNLISGIVAFGMLGLFLPLTIFLQSVLGLTPLQAGIVLVPNALTSMFVAPIAGRLSDRISGKYILAFGLTLFAVGMGLVIWVASLHSTGTTFTIPLIISGLGMGCTFAPLVAVSMRNVAPTQAGAASGFLNTVRQVGGAAGSAVVGAVLQSRLAIELQTEASHYAASAHLPPAVRAKFVSGFSNSASGGFQVGRGQTGAGNLPHNLPPALLHELQTLAQTVFQHAFLYAMKPALAIAIIVMLVGAASAFLMQTSQKSSQAAAARQDQEQGGYAAAGE
jgi:EmrB/QacA subfamily drug resistance transporter